MSLEAGPSIVHSGLLLHLDAGNAKSYPGTGTTWTDLSGNGGVGTLVSATYDSANGGAIAFDGATDKVTVANSFPALPTFTIEMFLRHHLLDGTMRIILDQYGSLRVQINTNKYQIHLGNDTGWVFTADYSVGSPVVNVWQHFAWVWDGGTSSLYLDGKLDYAYTHSAAACKTGSITLGQHTPDTNYNWNGKIASLRIYDRGLAATEISQNFASLRGRFGL